MKKSALILMAVLGCMVLQPTQAVTYFDNKQVNNKQVNKKRKKSISASEAANMVQSKFGGKILKVQPSSKGYRVKVLKDDGRIITVYVDGITGHIRG